MRGNGLSADTYVAVADLDPRTADVLLADLRAHGVAAYAADSPDPGQLGRVERLYVDAAAEDQARSMVDQWLAPSSKAGPTPPSPDPGAEASVGPGQDLDFDAAFADIVAGFHQPSGSAGRWPVNEDLTAEPGPVDEPASPRPGQAGTAAPPASHTGWEDVLRPQPAKAQPDDSAPDADRYVPPPPPPLPHASRRAAASWAAVTGGPAVLFAAAIFGWSLPGFVLFFAVIAFLAGFGSLVAGLKDSRDGDGGDDGAVV